MSRNNDLEKLLSDDRDLVLDVYADTPENRQYIIDQKQKKIKHIYTGMAEGLVVRFDEVEEKYIKIGHTENEYKISKCIVSDMGYIEDAFFTKEKYIAEGGAIRPLAELDGVKIIKDLNVIEEIYIDNPKNRKIVEDWVEQHILEEPGYIALVPDNFNEKSLIELGYHQSVKEGGWISKDRSTMVITNKSFYRGQVRQYTAGSGVSFMSNIAELRKHELILETPKCNTTTKYRKHI